MKSNEVHRRASQLVILSIAIGLPGPAVALEEVVVTARKRTESLQDVAMTVSAFSEDTIREANLSNADDLAILSPALTITTNNSPFTAGFRIRGIGTAQTDLALEPSVGIFVDEVYLNRSGLGMSDLTDIQRIEVLHGPQGTLYGKTPTRVPSAFSLRARTSKNSRAMLKQRSETTIYRNTRPLQAVRSQRHWRFVSLAPCTNATATSTTTVPATTSTTPMTGT